MQVEQITMDLGNENPPSATAVSEDLFRHMHIDLRSDPLLGSMNRC
jgi:hypothetical protein